MRPLCGLSEACSLPSSYGLPKATLGILDRPQTPLGSWQACLFSWPVPGLPLLSYSRPASNVRPFGPPPNPSRQLAGLPLLLACPRPASSLLMGFDPKATLGIVDRPQTPLGSWQACLSLLMASESNVTHCGPPPNPSRQLAGVPATLGILDRPQTLLGSWQACLFSSYGLPKATLTHFGRPSNPSRQLAGLPLLFLWVSESNIIAILGRPQTLLRSWQRRCPGSKPLPGTLGCTFLHRSLACESRCYSWSLSISSCRACSPELASSLSGIVFLKVCCVWPECAQRAVLTRPHCGMRGTFADAGVSAR